MLTLQALVIVLTLAYFRPQLLNLRSELLVSHLYFLVLCEQHVERLLRLLQVTHQCVNLPLIVHLRICIAKQRRWRDGRGLNHWRQVICAQPLFHRNLSGIFTLFLY